MDVQPGNRRAVLSRPDDEVRLLDDDDREILGGEVGESAAAALTRCEATLACRNTTRARLLRMASTVPAI